MKPSELPKNKRDSVRINKDIDTALRKEGESVQKLLDWAVDQRVKVKTDIKIKPSKK